MDATDTRIAKILAALGEQIRRFLPAGWGFTLLLFDFKSSHTHLFYISNADRESMIAVMHEFILKQEQEKDAGNDKPRTTGRVQES